MIRSDVTKSVFHASVSLWSFAKYSVTQRYIKLHFAESCHSFNPLPDMPILGSFNSAANKDVIS